MLGVVTPTKKGISMTVPAIRTCGRINLFNTSSRTVLFLHGRVVIAEEITEKTAMVCEIMIDQSGKMVGVEPINIRFAELLIAWVIDH